MTKHQAIKDLGRVVGKLLFFGGVYSNLQALQALRAFAESNHFPPGNIFCTGDILGYCAQPVECIELIRDWKINVIAGNVELQIRDGEEDCGCDFTTGGRCDLLSKNWYAYTKSKMNTKEKDWLRSLPEFIQFKYLDTKLTVLHGSWFNTSEFIFKSTPWSRKQENFVATKSDVIVAGHCGLPFADAQKNYCWLNAGVIGMPANDGTSRVWFLTMQDYNKDEPLYRFHNLEYDYTTAANLMLANNLPASYAKTLSTGIWDNCEILPQAETQAQGVPLVL